VNWFVALNEASFRPERYAELFKVAVHTALTTTGLVPHLIYDGGETPLIQWARARGVRVIPCRTFLYDQLARIAEARRDPNLLAIGAGALLRIELPEIARQQGISDPYVLYTDLDVMFMTDVCPFLRTLTPKLFAVAAEFEQTRPDLMNTGVMLMNVDALRAVDRDFRLFVSAHLAELVTQNWDQGAYRQYFGRPSIATKLVGTRWDELPPAFNWKPHWGANPDAAIVHFHGPKPRDREALRSGQLEEHEQWMTRYAGGAYDALTDKWMRMLSDAAL
jgi:hypothetical protein